MRTVSRRRPLSRAISVWPSTTLILATCESGTGMPSAVGHRQPADRLRRSEVLAVELADDVEPPLAFVQSADRLAAEGRVDQLGHVLDADVVPRAERPVGLE